ncbi:hypothetical protein Tco_0520449 [Tanacetum coccineum]
MQYQHSFRDSRTSSEEQKVRASGRCIAACCEIGGGGSILKKSGCEREIEERGGDLQLSDIVGIEYGKELYSSEC